MQKKINKNFRIWPIGKLVYFERWLYLERNINKCMWNIVYWIETKDRLNMVSFIFFF